MFLLRGVSQSVISLGCEGKHNHVYCYRDLLQILIHSIIHESQCTNNREPKQRQRRRQRQRQKTIGFMSKTTALHVHHAF